MNNFFAFFGTPAVSSTTLEKLIENGFVPSLVVTAPDAPVGRGLILTPSPVKTLALAHNITVITPEKLDTETINLIRSKKFAYAIVVAYGKIFPQELIDVFPMGVLNVHYSLLPKYRGATPLESALLAGDAITGVTIQRMVFDVDAGDILAQKETPIGADETARELRPRLIALGAGLLVETLPGYLSGAIEPRAQDLSQSSFTKKIRKEDGELKLDAPPEENWLKYRAYADGIGTYFFSAKSGSLPDGKADASGENNGKRMKITKASFKKGKFIVEWVIPEGKKETDYRG